MPDAPAGDQIASHISRKWLLKMVLITLFLVAFGFWGLYDAAIAYPHRGSRASEAFELDYLQQSAASGLRSLGISDPKAELDRLHAKSAQTPLSPAETAAEQWLASLALIGHLDGPTATDIPRTDFRGEAVADAPSRLKTLRDRFQTLQPGANGRPIDAPSPLSRWDIPVQWLFVVAGLGGGAWMLLLLLRVASRRFYFEPAARRLTLPGGKSLVPTDLEDVDKRRWHKFFVVLRVKPGHPTLGGKSVQLDLLRYVPVEEWVLEMERAAFPDRVEPLASPETPAPGPA